MTYHISTIDRAALRAYRLGRIQQQLRERDMPAALLFDPINIRYATDCPNMQVWLLHNRVRYAFVPADGGVTLFEFPGAEHLSADIETIAETRPGKSATYLISGSDIDADTRAWAMDIDDLLRRAGGANRRLAVDVVDPHMTVALAGLGIRSENGTQVMEHARWIKNDVEILAMREAIQACEKGMARMQAALQPGITENALFSILQQTNIELGGEWIETRLLTSGPKTKPWFQECGHRQIEAGDLVSFDTDMIGPNGYCADISRSWLCGDVAPTDEQRFIYRIAHEQIQHNFDLIRPGVSHRDISNAAYRVPERCQGTYYSMIAHGVGMCDEAPIIRHPWDLRDSSREDVCLDAGMVICVEALVAVDDGREAVKLEQMVHVTDDGPCLLNDYPFEDALLA
ncbi:MAG: aminopeptidase P family protein [Sphingopyxis sp.]|nr:aminopeptidase P family protein [Sphingopyxis sp.]